MGAWVLPETTGGEACSCQYSRAIGFQTSVSLASTVLFKCQKRGACTLGTLTRPWFESAFFASFLCRFGQRNDVPPRTVANSAKKYRKHKPREGLSSSNPAPTPTTRTGRPRKTVHRREQNSERELSVSLLRQNHATKILLNTFQRVLAVSLKPHDNNRRRIR